VSTRWLVIGGGTAGCVVASRLSEDDHNEVVLLEAGPDHGPGPVPDRGGAYLDEHARQYPELTVIRRQGGAPEPYPQGFGLGGTTLISGGLAAPDPELFAVSNLLPIEKTERLGMLGSAVLDADARARAATLVRHNGERVTVADVYLRPALLRTNLMVVTESPVVSLALGGWSVVRAVTADGIEYEADRFVVCAGAIQTPTLLLRSGLDTPGIGEALRVMNGIGWTYVILAEVINAPYGLGALITVAGKRGRVDQIFALVIVILVIGVVSDQILKLLNRSLFRWKT